MIQELTEELQSIDQELWNDEQDSEDKYYLTETEEK